MWNVFWTLVQGQKSISTKLKINVKIVAVQIWAELERDSKEFEQRTFLRQQLKHRAMDVDS